MRVNFKIGAALDRGAVTFLCPSSGKSQGLDETTDVKFTAQEQPPVTTQDASALFARGRKVPLNGQSQTERGGTDTLHMYTAGGGGSGGWRI